MDLPDMGPGQHHTCRCARKEGQFIGDAHAWPGRRRVSARRWSTLARRRSIELIKGWATRMAEAGERQIVMASAARRQLEDAAASPTRNSFYWRGRPSSLRPMGLHEAPPVRTKVRLGTSATPITRSARGREEVSRRQSRDLPWICTQGINALVTGATGASAMRSRRRGAKRETCVLRASCDG